MNKLMAATRPLIALGATLLLLGGSWALQAGELVGTPVPADQPEVVVQAPSASQESPAQQKPSAQDAPIAPPALPVSKVDVPVYAGHGWAEEMTREFGNSDFDGVGAEVLIPIIAIVLLFGGPLLLGVLFIVFYFRAKARRQQTINMNIDKLLAAGRDIPLELLRGVDNSDLADDASLNKGIKNICLGVGWLIFLTIMFGINIGSAGFILIGLGVSRVIVWRLSTRQQASRTEIQG
jgi:hypothetical protein